MWCHASGDVLLNGDGWIKSEGKHFGYSVHCIWGRGIFGMSTGYRRLARLAGKKVANNLLFLIKIQYTILSYGLWIAAEVELNTEEVVANVTNNKRIR